MLWLFSGMGVQLVEVGFLTRVPLSWPILNVLDVSLAEQGLGNSYSVIFWNKNKHILRWGVFARVPLNSYLANF